MSAQYEITAEDGRRLAPEELIAFRAAVRGEVVKRVVNRVQSLGGEPRWLMLSAIPLFVEGEHAGAVLSLADITDRKRAGDALHEANEKLRAVRFDVELADVPLWADADPTRIAQLVGNLLHNAAKFTRDAPAPACRE